MRRTGRLEAAFAAELVGIMPTVGHTTRHGEDAMRLLATGPRSDRITEATASARRSHARTTDGAAL
jgi:hypothetical protein